MHSATIVKQRKIHHQSSSLTTITITNSQNFDKFLTTTIKNGRNSGSFANYYQTSTRGLHPPRASREKTLVDTCLTSFAIKVVS